MALLTGTWSMNGNGHLGQLIINSVDAQGKLNGTVYGQAIEGFWDDRSQKITFIRVTSTTDPSRLQIYTGFQFKTPPNPGGGQNFSYTLSGYFEAFAGTGAVAHRTLIWLVCFGECYWLILAPNSRFNWPKSPRLMLPSPLMSAVGSKFGLPAIAPKFAFKSPNSAKLTRPS